MADLAGVSMKGGAGPVKSPRRPFVNRPRGIGIKTNGDSIPSVSEESLDKNDSQRDSSTRLSFVAARSE
jgi:hypothetical protein